MKSILLIIIILAVIASMGLSTELNDYVNIPDNNFTWSIQNESKNPSVMKIEVDMVSQVWQGITWKHKVVIFRPVACKYPNTASLFITGNYRGNNDELALASLLASRTKSTVAVLFDVPNQPLFDNLYEDALIAYTLIQYFETKDATWPLHFPMVKSALRAMDTIQEFSIKKDYPKINKFVVMGVSKRGWTTWLAAAVDRQRIKGIIPMVYDNLNLTAQMERQIVSFGEYSEMIDDYTKYDLQSVIAGENKDPIADAIDPWHYRNYLTMPKLIINGSNDPYWPQDALNLYWDGLKGRKSVLYIANSGHGLINNDKGGTKLKTLVGSVSAFIKSIAENSPLPHINWKYIKVGSDYKLNINNAAPSKYTAKIWMAESKSRDFRESEWKASEMTKTENGYSAVIKLPKEGFIAIFGEASTKAKSETFTESTQIQIFDKTGKVD